MRVWAKGLVLATGIWLVMVNMGPVWGEEPKKSKTTEIPAEMQEPPVEKPVEPSGYVPGTLSASPYGTLDMGPVAGYLAPYGNPAAYDSLLRGWRSHRVGKATVTPYFELDGLYRSNIYLTPTDKKGDFIFTLIPGLRAEVPIAGSHRLSVGYLGSGFVYSKYSDNSHYDQNINVDLALNFKGGLNLRLGNTTRLAVEERNSDFAVQRHYLRETPYVTASYAFADRWKLEASYQYDMLYFSNPEFRANDFNQQNVGMTLYYRFLPKTAVLVQYIFTYRYFPYSSPDTVSGHSPLVGLTWDPTAKLSGTMKFGYSFENYANPQPGRNNAPANYAMSLNLLYRFSKVTNLTVLAQRSFQQDVDSNNSPNVSTGVWVTLTHEWAYFKLYSFASFFYINSSYINPAFDANGQFLRRLDNTVGFGVGLGRPITSWLRARIEYNYSNRNSNFPGYSYNDNRVLVGLQTSF